MAGRKRTGTQDLRMKSLIFNLLKLAKDKKTNIWKKLAEELSKPARSRRIANLSQIDRYSTNGEIVVIPGKVLGSGNLSHKLKIAAPAFSSSALKKIGDSGSLAISIEELLKENPKGTGVRIILE